jgi:hypothetical protein
MPFFYVKKKDIIFVFMCFVFRFVWRTDFVQNDPKSVLLDDYLNYPMF